MADQDRRWIEQHAIAFALGELDEATEARFRAAAADDSEFEELLHANPDAGHVPAALIARWHAARRRLGEHEASLVEAHIEHCPSCREELQLVGVSFPRSGTVMAGPSWWPWIGGAVLGAAAMVAFLMFAMPRPTTLHGERLDVVVPRAVRGLEIDVVRLAADAPAFLLAVALPGDVAPGAEATLVLVGPDGEQLLDTALGAAPWQPPSTQILVLAEPRFRTGDYDVRLRVAGEDEPRELGRFRIELR